MSKSTNRNATDGITRRVTNIDGNYARGILKKPAASNPNPNLNMKPEVIPEQEKKESDLKGGDGT